LNTNLCVKFVQTFIFTGIQMVTGLVCKSNSESFMYRCFIYDVMEPVLDLPIGYIGLSLGPQDPRGPPKNCGTHRVNAGI